mgnify:CR=1 FL=1
MAYYGNAPADVALVVGQDVITTTEIQDSTIATADIANDAITALKIDDDGTGFQMGSLGLGTAVSGSEKLTVGGTASFTDDVSLSVAGKRYYIPRASDGALTGSLYSSTGNTITLSGAGSSSGILNFIPSASNSSAVAMTIKANGEIQFGDSNNTASLYHYGEGKFAINDSAGSASTPTYAFNSDTDTGMYRGGANDLRFATSGTERMKIESDGTVVIPGAIQSTGNVSITSTAKYFQVMSHADSSLITKHAYDGLYTSGSQHQYIQSGQDIKFYPGGTNEVTFADGGLATFAGNVTVNGDATFNQNIITKSESNHTFTSSGTDNVAIKRQVWYSSYSSHNFQLSTTDSGSSKYLILSTLGSNGHIDWKISGSRMSQVYASITFMNYADASGRTAYLEWSDDEGQNWNTVDTHGSWGAGGATVAATINTANGSSQTGGSSSGSSSGSNQIIIRARFVGGGGSYIGITNVTIKPTASYWTFVPVPRGYYNTTINGITASTKSVQGTWTKMGRQVFIQAYITISGKSGGSGNPYIALPFTPSDIGVPASTVGANIHKNTSISNLVYFGLYGANAQIYANDGNGGYIGHSDWANGVVGFTLQYNAL